MTTNTIHRRIAVVLALALGASILHSAETVDGKGKPLDLPKGAVLRLGNRQTGDGSDVAHLAYSLDGKKLTIAHASGTIRVLDAKTGQETSKFTVGKENPVALSSDGAVVVTSEGGSLKRWTIADGKAKVRPRHPRSRSPS